MSACNDPLPIYYLRVIAKECPLALETYLQLWNAKDSREMVCVDNDEVCEKFLISKAKFNHNLRQLASAALISYHKIRDKVVIEVTSWDKDIDLL